MIAFNETVGPFNYLRANAAIDALIGKEYDWQLAQGGIKLGGSPVGRQQNEEVAEIVLRFFSGRRVRKVSLSPPAIRVRPDLQMPCNPNFGLIEDGRPIVFWVQPRKTFTLHPLALALLARAFHMQGSSLDPVWRRARIEILDLAAPAGKAMRCFRQFVFAPEELPSLESLDEAVGRVLQAYDELVAAGYEPRERRRGGRRDDQPGFFD